MHTLKQIWELTVAFGGLVITLWGCVSILRFMFARLF